MPENAWYFLPLHILKDLWQNNRTLLLLTFLLFVTMLGTVWLTYNTRLLIVEKGKLSFEQQSLEHEFVHLTLEETTLMDKTRIAQISREKLGMQSVAHEQEILLRE